MTKQNDLTGWLCVCGEWVDWEFHCTNCGNEPPWGCDCADCEDKYLEVDETEIAIWNALCDEGYEIL